MFFVGCDFSEMASQKWIVLFAFHVLITHMVEVRSSSASIAELIQQLKKTVTNIKSCNYICRGKSPNCPCKNVTETRPSSLPFSFPVLLVSKCRWRGSGDENGVISTLRCFHRVLRARAPMMRALVICPR